MIVLRLGFSSLANRWSSTLLTVLSIALSVSLLLAVERTKRAAEESFTQSVSGVDLLVGARTGPLNLILYTVFNMGSASNNISWLAYQELKSRAEIEWTIPYSIGDGHRGFRVVATDANFYEHYRFRQDQKVELSEGHPALDIWDVVIGAEVQRKLNYKIGDAVIIAHGVTHGEAIQKHEDKPFRIVGIMKTTGTALDQSLYISLYGMEAMHLDWQEGAAPTKETAIAPSQIRKEDIKIDSISSFFLRTKNRVETLSLQRVINEYKAEALLAIIPGLTLAEFWQGLSQVETILKIISWLVLVVGLAAMASSILAGLNERRREMAILRSLGAGPSKLTGLLLFESFLLTLIGIIFGVAIELGGFFLLSGWLERQFGFYVVGTVMTSTEWWYLLVTCICGSAVGFIPGIKASRIALKDGLAVRV